MPRENKKRGRRAEAQKRKHDEEDEDGEQTTKRPKFQDELSADPAQLDEPAGHDEASTFEYYGMLDAAEQEYFRAAHETLEQNQFEDMDARQAFLDNLHTEVKGKELKLACSQSWSRLLEKLIQLSTRQRLRDIFVHLQGHFVQLVQHRFASHVCETLFTAAGPYLTQADDVGQAEDGAPSEEDMILSVVSELEGDLGFLITDRFASHTLRVLLVILAGLPLDPPGNQSVVRSKRKENVDVSGYTPPDIMYTKRSVPDSFTAALRQLLSKSTEGLDATALKTLAMHPIGNPTLQLLVRVEVAVFGKAPSTEEPTLLNRLLPDTDVSEESETMSFLNGLVYDTVGSRLLETLVECVPGKTFKVLHRQYFKDRLGTLARNEIAGYVVCRVLERLGPEDLKGASATILPLVPSLLERDRFAVLKTLLERLAVRKANTGALVKAISESLADDEGQFSLAKLLKLSSDVGTTDKDANKDAESTPAPAPSASKAQQHASALAQAMVVIPGPPADLVFHALAELSYPVTIYMARSPVFSRILQDALTAPHAPIIMRRKIVTRLQANIASLATHPCGSHVIDSTWTGTNGMAFLRERIAEELAEAETQLRESIPGRKVWRNWRMDLYKRRRGEWVRQIRREAGNDGFLSFPDGDDEAAPPKPGNGTNGSGALSQLRSNSRNGSAKPAKTALQLARERYVRKAKSGVTSELVATKKQRGSSSAK